MQTYRRFERSAPALGSMIILFLTITAGWPRPAPGSNIRQTLSKAPRTSAPSPIQDFVAYVIPAGVQLAWAVAHERDIEGFIIYRSEDGSSFSCVNKDGLLEAYRHTLVDGSVVARTSYLYALGVILDDGSESLSQPIRVETPPESSSLVAGTRLAVRIWGFPAPPSRQR